MSVIELLNYCFNDYVKIIGKVTEYDGAIKEVPYRLINCEVIGISVTWEDYTKLVIKL